MKKKFTLVEILVVISIIGILAAIVLPNIKDVQVKGSQSAIASNIRNLQTAVDTYMLDNYNKLPVNEVNAFDPHPLVDVDALYPDYIRSLPEKDNAKYWIDAWGTVWGSQIDAPIISNKDMNLLTWESVPQAKSYNIYEVEGYQGQNVLLGTTKESILKLKFVLNTNKTSLSVMDGADKIKLGKAYVVSSVDSLGFETAPSGVNYKGYDNEVSSGTSPEPSTATVSSRLFTEGYSYYYLTSDGHVKSWGDNSFGQLGLGDTKKRTLPTIIPNLENVKQIFPSRSGFSVSIIDGEGNVKVWGYNANNQLGVPSTSSSSQTVLVPTVVPELFGHDVKEMFLIPNATFALMKDGTMMAVGENSRGTLGVGDRNNKSKFQKIPNLSDVSIFKSGVESGFAVLNDGTLKVWGYNSLSQLANAGSTVITNPTIMPDVSNVKNVYPNNYAVIIEMKDGTFKGWGYNSYGQVGVGSTQTVIDKPTLINLSGVKKLIAGNYNYFSIMNDDSVKVWGKSDFNNTIVGQKNSPTTIPALTNVQNLYWKSYHVLALIKDGTVQGFGQNSQYEMCVVDKNRYVLNLNEVSEIVTASNSTFFIKKDGNFFSCGVNGNGALGVGDTSNRTTPTLVNLQ